MTRIHSDHVTPIRLGHGPDPDEAPDPVDVATYDPVEVLRHIADAEAVGSW